jgi:chorismate mutase
MTVRHTVALLAGATLIAIPFVVAPTARADDPGPLYELVDAAAARLETADPVAAFKWVDGGAVEDPARVQQVLDAVGADAVDRGIDPQSVRTVFADQIHASEGVQYTRFGQWKLDPAAAPTTAPDLAASRTAIDDLNHTMVAEMAQHWDVLRGPICARDRDDAERAVVARHHMDALHRQALAFATRSYCG